MPIEGELRDLGVHEIFQLLDLGRKTGALHVRSVLRENAGAVYFDRGAVVGATIRTNPHLLGAVLVRGGMVSEEQIENARQVQQAGDRRRLGRILVDQGVLDARSLARHMRLQIEAVVLELLSWQEGSFAFNEISVAELPVDIEVRVSAESLLMEASRRVAAWSEIQDLVPSGEVVPVFAPLRDKENAPRIALRPPDWTVLAAVDGSRSIVEIADTVGFEPFDVARSIHGMIATSLLELKR
jgi:hypothetical protein